MREPDNHTVLADRDDDLWVRFDEWPHPYAVHRASWRHISTGTCWEPWARDKVGSARDWGDIQDYRPLTEVSPDRAAWALAKVKAAHSEDPHG